MELAGQDRTPATLEWIAKLDSLRTAWKRVRRNGGGPGADQETIERFLQGIDERLSTLTQELTSGRYRPGPLLRYRIPKTNGKWRKLSVPCVRDRVVQAAAAQVLDAIFDSGMAPSSFAYRRGLSVEHAAGLVTMYRLRGFVHVVDGDIADFFDNAPHGAVFGTLRGTVCPKTLRVVALWLSGFGAKGRGLAQGSPLSPLLANLVLSPVDRAIETKKVKLVRYADDFLLMARRHSDAEKAAAHMAELLRPLGLSLNADKTRIATLTEGVRFLGLRFRGASVVREAQGL